MHEPKSERARRSDAAGALRAACTLPRWFARGVYAWVMLRPGSRPRRMAGRGMREIATWVRADPGRRALVGRTLRRVPWLETRIRLALRPRRATALAVDANSGPLLLSVPARRIYRALYGPGHAGDGQNSR